VPRGGKIRRGEAWEEKRGRKEAGWKETRSSRKEERRGEERIVKWGRVIWAGLIRGDEFRTWRG
jgi:hypothetical protein